MLAGLGLLFLIIGGFFLAVSGIGLWRMPDLFNRLQAGTKATTLGILCLLVGAGLIHPEWITKLILIGAFVLLTNPLGSHYLAMVSQRIGEPMFILPSRTGDDQS